MFPEGRILDFLIVGVIALIVVGPKDLPILMRKVGRFIAHMRGMAAEFRASFDELARQSELDELRKEVEALRHAQPLSAAVGLGPDGGVQQVFDDIHAGLRAGEGQLHPVMSHQYPMPLAADVAQPASVGSAAPGRSADPAAPRPPGDEGVSGAGTALDAPSGAGEARTGAEGDSASAAPAKP